MARKTSLDKQLQPHPMCAKTECACKGIQCNYLHKKYGMKRWVFWLIVITISIGAFVPFFAQVICTFWFPDVSLGLSTWNQFVSIILGIVATIVSIVSIIMGFKNYDDTLEVQGKYMEALKEISNMAKDLSQVSKAVHDMTSLGEKVSITTPQQLPDRWDEDPNEFREQKTVSN